MTRPPLPVLAEGNGWLVIGKPPRLIVHKTAMSTDRVAALQWVRDQLGTRVYAVHRIDRAASGNVLFGVDKAIAGDLHGALRRDDTEKVYLALVRGAVPAGEHTIVDRPLDGKEARTEVLVLGSSPDPRCSLVACRIHTGRFHQIRRHLAGISHPILGDSNHGDTRVNRWWRENRGLHRLALHSWKLGFTWEDQRQEARCPLWPDLAAVARALPFWAEAVAAEPALDETFADLPPWHGVPGVPDGASPEDGHAIRDGGPT